MNFLLVLLTLLLVLRLAEEKKCEEGALAVQGYELSEQELPEQQEQDLVGYCFCSSRTCSRASYFFGPLFRWI